jgi:membrane protease YdiL (CAAX protease family)
MLPAAIVCSASLACVLFTYLTPPLFKASALASSAIPGTAFLLGTLGSDRAIYWIRFFASFLLLGLLPAWVLSRFRISLADAGLRMPVRGARATFGSPFFLLALIAAPFAGAIASLSPGLGAFYPYSRDLVAMTRAGGAWPMLGHLAAYFFLYYLPWEFFFRGFLLFPLLGAAAESSPLADDPGRPSAGLPLAAIVLFQTLPSTLLHFGHPTGELLSAIPAGLVFGILAWRTKSILPGLLLHAAIGFGTDIAIVLRALADGGKLL